jgi:enoyl-CoA hydratase/carnithine racemase
MDAPLPSATTSPTSAAEAAATFGDVTIEQTDDAVGTVEMRRPPANYFDTALLRGLLDAIAWAEDRGARAIVLCAQGKHFCAGAQFGNGSRSLDTSLYEVGAKLFAQRLPIVAAINGSAVGGGLGLALAADFRIATPKTRFSANFVALGLHHGFGLTVTLPRVIGHQHALDMLCTARTVEGTEALRLGLCDQVVAASDLRPAAHQLAGQLAAGAPLALASVRATMRGDLESLVTKTLRHELDEQNRLTRTADFREGVRAAAQRRTPLFEGR